MNGRSPRGSRLRPPPKAYWIALATAVVVMIGVAAQPWVPGAVLTRDAIADLGGWAYMGLISNLGILIWAAAAVSCYLAAFLIRRLGGTREDSAFLLASAALTTLLLLDDFFLFHEQLFPLVLHIRERYVYVGYAVAVGMYLLRFRGVLLGPRWPILALAFVFFGASVFVDANTVHLALMRAMPEDTVLVLEDAFKLFGQVSWAYCFLGEATTRTLAVARASRPLAPAAETPRPPAAAARR